MLLEAFTATLDLQRLHEIASVLIRHGLGDLVRRLHLAPLLQRAGRVLHWERTAQLDKDPALRLREALEELGPTFVKLGQLLAGRADLLPPAWTRELSMLREHASPVPFSELLEPLIEDLGSDPRKLFLDFEEEPLASASIAQVHRAKLQDGTPVVLKIRRPSIDIIVEKDMRLLSRIAVRLEERSPELQRYRPSRFVRQLSRSLRDELDLRVETRNFERLRSSLPEDSGIVIPRVFDEWTRERLCVMDYLEGPSVGQWLQEGRPGNVDQHALATRGAEAILRMVFVEGCYHADPHPGNLILMPDGRTGLIDFGMVGTLSEARRLEFLDLLIAVSSRRVEEAVEILVGWSEGEVDFDGLTQDCSAFIDRYYGLSLGQLDTSALLMDLTALLRDNSLFLPTDVAMLLKVFLTLDDLGLQIDPDFVMAAHVQPFAEQAVGARHSPRAVAKQGLAEIGKLARSLPRDLRGVLDQARRGRLHLELDIQKLDEFGRKIDRSANRLTVGLVTAALIVGTSITLNAPGSPRLFGAPVLGLLGFTCSFALGIGLLWSILRSGRG